MAFLSKSPWIIHYDGSSCNGCDIEVLACLTPVYDVERLGIINTGNPKHADILLITGAINEQNREVVRNIYDQMPDPKVVVALGICATSGGIFAECYNVIGGVDHVIPVDVYVPGCAVRPEHIIDGVAMSLKVLEDKRTQLASMLSGKVAMVIEEAQLPDAAEILDLQKLAYQSEAELYDDFTLTPLRQTLEELRGDFSRMLFLKATLNNKIVGSVRAYIDGDSCMIRRLIVHPLYRGLGINSRLLQEVEGRFSGKAGRYEVFAGHKSKRNIHFYQERGYAVFKCTTVSVKRERVYLEKPAKKVSA